MLDTVELVVFVERDGKRWIAKPLEFEPFENSLYAHAPTASFPSESRVPHQLKQELKTMGLIDGADAATVKAKDAHLEDMRALVFKKGEKK